jgi:hypothetical protein
MTSPTKIVSGVTGLVAGGGMIWYAMKKTEGNTSGVVGVIGTVLGISGLLLLIDGIATKNQIAPAPNTK